MASTNWYIDCLVASKSDGFASICEKLFAAPVTPSLLPFETIMATPHRRNLSGIVENMIRFTYE